MPEIGGVGGRTLEGVPAALHPRFWAGHLLALVLVAAAVGLGLWQLNAWSTRRAQEAINLTELAPVPIDSVIGPDAPFPGLDVGHPVTVSGTWVPAATVFISGRLHQGHEGFWVVTPLAIGSPTGSAVPVVRGWVPSVASAPAAPTGTATLVGLLQPPEDGDTPDPVRSDDVLPQLRIADLLQRMDQDLYGAYVVADPHEAGTDAMVAADAAQLPDAGTFTAVRNLVYAIQWWIFGAFAVFVWSKWIRDVNADALADPAAEPLEPLPVP